MDLVCLTITLVCLLYLILILFFATGWFRKQNYHASKPGITHSISIIIAARNEEKQIPFLLEALKNQTHPPLEIILADDHSTDDTVKIISESNIPGVKVLLLPDDIQGKKNAIAYAIHHANGELVVTTDADCVPGKDWIKTISAFYDEENPDFIICPVKQSCKSFIQNLFSLDFMALQASGAGAAEMKTPFMCNGANMAFKKTLWEESSDSISQKYASGDDVFLLHAAIKNSPCYKIRYLFSQDAMVTTPAPDSIQSFLNQRIRWASKATGYKNTTAIITSIIVFLANLSLIVLLVASFFSINYAYCFLGMFAIKSVADFSLLSPSASFFKERRLLLYFIPLKLVYFIYTPFIALFSLFSNYTWKDRKVR